MSHTDGLGGGDLCSLPWWGSWLSGPRRKKRGVRLVVPCAADWFSPLAVSPRGVSAQRLRVEAPQLHGLPWWSASADTGRAMAQENVEIVRRTWEIVQRVTDIGAAFDECVREGLVAPDYRWRGGPRGGRAIAGIEDANGRDEYVEMMRRFAEGFEDVRFEVERIIDAGNDRVVSVTRLFATGAQSGVPVELHSAHLHWLDAGCIVRTDEFLDPAEALEAAGLRE